VTRKDLERRLGRMAWPAASADLRARVMRSASPHEREIGWIDRLWFSRAWRLSMAAAAVAIVLIGQWAAARPEPAVPPDSTLAQTEALEELVQRSGIPAAEAASLVRRARGRRTASSPSTAIVDLFPVEGVHR
jgi:hypothetical protein